MKLTPIQKRAARNARHGNSLDMNLVSLIDVFTILIFFLLSNSGVETLPASGAVHLPESTAKKDPKETLVVVVSANEITVEGRRVSDVASLANAPDDLIPGLKAERARRERGHVEVRDHHGRQGHPVPVAAQGDVHRRARRLHERVLRREPEGVTMAPTLTPFAAPRGGRSLLRTAVRRAAP